MGETELNRGLLGMLCLAIGILLGSWWASPPDVIDKPSPIVSHCPEFDEDGPTINIHGVCDTKGKQ
jgi:hypothetical protein